MRIVRKRQVGGIIQWQNLQARCIMMVQGRSECAGKQCDCGVEAVGSQVCPHGDEGGDGGGGRGVLSQQNINPTYVGHPPAAHWRWSPRDQMVGCSDASNAHGPQQANGEREGASSLRVAPGVCGIAIRVPIILIQPTNKQTTTTSKRPLAAHSDTYGRKP